MFKEKTSAGADAYEAAQAIRRIREVHTAFEKWLCDHLARSSNNEFAAAIEANVGLVIQTPAGQIVSRLELIGGADATVGRLVFYEPEQKAFGLPARPLFAIRLYGNFDIVSGDQDGHKWEVRENGWRTFEAHRLGYELLLAQLTARG